MPCEAEHLVAAVHGSIRSQHHRQYLYDLAGYLLRIAAVRVNLPAARMPACSNAPEYIRHENNGLPFLRYGLVELNRASQETHQPF
jgi:hypothetical protein